MGLFEQFPYTNFHELNLDWLLQNMKKLGADVDKLRTDIYDKIEDIINDAISQGLINIEYDSDTDTVVLVQGAGVPTADPVNYFQIGGYRYPVVDKISYQKAAVAEIDNKIGHIGSYDGRVQGVNGIYAVDNMLYQYYADDETSGTFKVFNMATGDVVDTLTGRSFYHGNDFTLAGGKLYCAPFGSGAGGGVNPNKTIIYGDPAMAVAEGYLDPFAALPETSLYAITAIDDDTLVCALRYYATYGFSDTVLYKYHITAQTIEAITLDWNGKQPTKYVNEFPHQLYYRDGLLILTTSFPNSCIVMTLDDNVATVKKIEYLPIYDNFGNPLEELEGVTSLKMFGTENMIMSFRSSSSAPYITYVAYNLDGGMPLSMYEEIGAVQQFPAFHYDPYSNFIIETGSATYPFKKFARAINAGGPNRVNQTGTFGNINMPVETPENIVVNRDIGITAPCTFNGTFEVLRGKCYIGGACVFNKVVTVRANGALYVSLSTFNNEIQMSTNGYLHDEQCNHNGAITINSAEAHISMATPADPISINAIYKSFITINRADTTGISVGGGSTLLTPGVK